MAIRLRSPNLDWPSVWAALGLVLIGLSTVYSATTVPGAHEGLWLRQLLWFGVALFVSRRWDQVRREYAALDAREDGSTSR